MTFIVAEIGVNWDGDFDLVKKMMLNAKQADCNAVKFQSFNEDTVKDHPQKERLLKSSITEDNIYEIDRIANTVDVEWFSTPMYPDAVDFLNSFVKRFKLRFHDGVSLLENKTTKLFEKIISTKKEVIVSSQTSPLNSKFYEHEQIKWLYVVPKYPCKIEDIDFTRIKEFNGYSNHCPHILVPLAATILGANIIEVHITPDKSGDFVDNPVSFDFNELKNLVELIRQAEKLSV
jgi:sialic acid synthase SpsE|tara:strand:- start:2196 stop:2894 length:699 start_codon:yes stop_codon:yes gene_type:complete